jgi:hypothetical protein
MALPLARPYTLPKGTKLLGEVISWDTSGCEQPYADVLAKLDQCGLSERFARALHPRNAFCRAVNKLAKERVIAVLDESPQVLTFQFTRTERKGDRLTYRYEAKLTLNKEECKVYCDEDPALAKEAKSLLDAALETRTAADLSRLVMRLVNYDCAVFPVRRQGGCYFIAQRDTGPLDAINRFAKLVGASMFRLPIPAGTAHGDASVRDVVATGIKDLIDDARKKAEEIAVTRKTVKDCGRSIQQRVEEAESAKFLIEGYSEYLHDAAATLEAQVSELRKLISEKKGEYLEAGGDDFDTDGNS